MAACLVDIHRASGASPDESLPHHTGSGPLEDVMTIAGWQIVCAVFLLTCLFSFAWGMKRFFVQPAGPTPGMRITAACGTAVAILHSGALLWPANVTVDRGRRASIIYLAALCLFWWAVKASRRRPLSAIFSPDQPAHLTTSGPYRFVRHPFYCAYLLTWLAGVVATASLPVAASFVAMLALYVHAARLEERKFLSSPLEPAYRGYQRRTGQLLPNPVKMLTAWRASRVQ
jgi:protein-S-isoprenylcysteine O-methyltransferase Ste14